MARRASSVPSRRRPSASAVVGVDGGQLRRARDVGRARATRSGCRRTCSAWSRSTRPCLNSSSTARKRTMTSSRSTSAPVSARNVMRPTRGSSSSSSATASATLTPGSGRRGRGRSRGTGLGVTARRKAVAQVVGRDALEQVGREVDEALVEPGHARERAAGRRRPGAGRATAASLNVLHSSSRARSRSRSSHSASSSSRSTSSSPGQQPAGLELDQRGGDEQELGGDVEVEVLHRARARPGRRRRSSARRDLVEVDLLAQDQVQQQVERALEDRGRAPRRASRQG